MSGLGQWKNAPLVYVIASIRFHPLAIDDSERDRLFAAMSKGLYSKYPERAASSAVAISLNDATVRKEPSMRWRSKNRRRRVGLSDGHLFVDASEYVDFGDFCGSFDHVVKVAWSEICERVNAFPSVTRVGLRYVDAISPEENGHYANSMTRVELKIPGYEIESEHLLRQEWGVSIRRDFSDHQMIQRVAYEEARDKRVLKDSMYGGELPLEPAELLLDGAVGNTAASLDFDHFIEDPSLPDDPGGLLTLLREMKKNAPLRLENIATESALELWNPKDV